MYNVNIWEIDRRNEWTFLPIIIFDFVLLLSQFYCIYALPIVRICAFMQFTMSLLVCLYYVLQHRWGTQDVENNRAEHLDLEKQRKKLASQQKNIKIGNDAYSHLFKSYHIETANKLQFLDEDRANAFQGAVFSFFVQWTFMGIIYEVIFNWNNNVWYIIEAQSVNLLAARCFSVLAMHLQLEPMLSLGLEMMKFCVNHPD